MATKKPVALASDVVAAARKRAEQTRRQLGHKPGPAELLTPQEHADAAPFYLVLRDYIRQLKEAREAAGVTLAERACYWKKRLSGMTGSKPSLMSGARLRLRFAETWIWVRISRGVAARRAAPPRLYECRFSTTRWLLSTTVNCHLASLVTGRAGLATRPPGSLRQRKAM